MYVQPFLLTLLLGFPGEVQLAGASLYKVYQISLAINQWTEKMVLLKALSSDLKQK